MIHAVYRPRTDDILLISPDGESSLPVPRAEAAELGVALAVTAGTPAHVARLLAFPSVNPTGDPI